MVFWCTLRRHWDMYFWIFNYNHTWKTEQELGNKLFSNKRTDRTGQSRLKSLYSTTKITAYSWEKQRFWDGPYSVCGVLSHFSHVWLYANLQTAAHQAPLSRGFSRQGYWSGLQCPPPGDLSNPGIEPASLMSSALADVFFTTRATWEATLKRKYKLS